MIHSCSIPSFTASSIPGSCTSGNAWRMWRLSIGWLLITFRISARFPIMLLPSFVNTMCCSARAVRWGRGCGPLVVARQGRHMDGLKGKRFATPGRYTTAHLLLRLFDKEIGHIVTMPFHEIMPAVAQGQVDAGVIIHESRFTFQNYGLQIVLDLGRWWECRTGLPLPRGRDRR